MGFCWAEISITIPEERLKLRGGMLLLASWCSVGHLCLGLRLLQTQVHRCSALLPMLSVIKVGRKGRPMTIVGKGVVFQLFGGEVFAHLPFSYIWIRESCWIFLC